VNEALEDAVLDAMSSDFLSMSVLKRRMGVGAGLDAALSALVQKGLIKGISLSGGDDDHFALTEKGLAVVEGSKPSIRPRTTGEGHALRAGKGHARRPGKRAT